MKKLFKNGAVAAIAALAFSASAFAQKPDAQTADVTLVTLSTCASPSIVLQEAGDQLTYESAMNAFSTASFPGLRINLPRLEDAMTHAPDCYPQIEHHGENIVIRVSDPSEYLPLSIAAAAAASHANQRATIAQARNTYADIALILGSYANENHDYERAIAWLDRGLRLQPRNQFLVLERASSLMALHRPGDAHDALKGALDDPEMALTLDRARYLRNDGIALIDLNRLDDAEAALNESIRLQPNNPVARSELQYVAELRAGQPSRGNAGITAPNAPRPETQ